jgi:hypothetical protein
VRRFARAAWALAALCLGGAGCGSAAEKSCAQATVMATCATTPALATCRDGHGNVCLECAGAGVSPGCIYDPSAPLDGGTAVCVKQCSDCGADCMAMK